ncbi:beta-1,3-galactosyltransferase 5 isoform X2 [Procambarus clarkii]|uniref:beta-1,3-galactosyltransferase 5 isoform X2 n=1 Tax=Procambarus clarkii TaxID=6728 RepID=UPI001E672CC0|nr:beta-1,3-galactosyltransferase 2-like isoform X2 [Procambarus clarkii]
MSSGRKAVECYLRQDLVTFKKGVIFAWFLVVTALAYMCLLYFQPESLYFLLPNCDEAPSTGAEEALRYVSPGHFLIEEADFCRRRPNLSIVAYVHSSISSVEKRMETRETWASAGAHDASVRMGVVFMVGRAKTVHEQRVITDESRRFHDIVQGNYTDTYHLLSHKALMSLQWVSRHCLHVPWTLHADDDVLIDTFFLTKFLTTNTTSYTNKIICYIWEKSMVRRSGRWCVPSVEFPEPFYPPYCAGGAWVMSTPLGSHLLEATSIAPFLWVDDVYITGVLAKYAVVGRSNKLKQYVRREGIIEEDLGRLMVWFEPSSSRKSWWLKLLVHRKYLVP